MARIKPFLSHTEQVELLISRGMHISNPRQAEEKLSTLNYYRLSGYWYSMRQVDPVTKNSLNAFRPGASFELAVALYDFDESLRQAIFAELVQIELAMRALIGYHLGKIDPLIHLSQISLGQPRNNVKVVGKIVNTRCGQRSMTLRWKLREKDLFDIIASNMTVSFRFG